jgi:hypothetical protein
MVIYLIGQAPQNVVIAESSYEYGSAQNRYGMSYQRQLDYIIYLKIKVKYLHTIMALKEISQNGMKNGGFLLFLTI